MAERCLAIRNKILGRDHPETLWTMQILAETRRLQGRYEEARDLFLKVLEGRRRILGPRHPELLRPYASVAHTTYQLGRFRDARQVLERGLAEREGRLDDRIALYAFGVLRLVDVAGGWPDEARRLDHEFLPICRDWIGRHNIGAGFGQMACAWALLDEGHASKADTEIALQSAERAVEETESEVYSAFAALALAHHALGHDAEAVQFQRKAIERSRTWRSTSEPQCEADLARTRRGRRWISRLGNLESSARTEFDPPRTPACALGRLSETAARHRDLTPAPRRP
jgi:tetratricopeptide (TPR) repeat protein